MNWQAWRQIEFVNPHLLWLLLLVPLLALWYFLNRNRQNAVLHMADTRPFALHSGPFTKLRPILYVLRLLAISCIITALARPRSTDVTSEIKVTKGVDIVMAVDMSASMLSEDLKPNRLEALKKIAANFVSHRKGDRIGLVTYAGEAFTRSPVTADHRIVVNALSALKYGYLKDGTAIGLGLGTAVNRLKNSHAKSKVIILLTDGVNNVGAIDPLTMAQVAKAKGIKVYTIGVGRNGYARTPVSISPTGRVAYENVKVTIDEALLKQIAKITGGRYFRASNNRRFSAIYSSIDKMEKTAYKEFKYYNYTEQYRPLVVLALLFLGFEVLLRWTLFKTFA